MSHLKTPARVMIAALVFVLLATACAPTNPLLGSWTEDSSGMILEFESTGKMNMIVSADMTASVDYQLVDSDTVLIKASSLGSGATDVQWDFAVEGQTLTISMDGASTTLTRNNQ